MIFLVTLGAALLFMVLAWLVSLPKKDVSIVDAFWGPAFLVVAAVAAWQSDGAPARRTLVLVLVAAWALRLGIYLLWRNLRMLEEDARYQAMRARWGARFPWVSLGTVFLLQGLLAWFISFPLQLAVMGPEPPGLGLLDLLGLGLWLVGFSFETIGDAQLVRFKADPANRGKVLSTGLWRYTRHPNYFGDFLVWWGFFALALSTPGGWMTIASPLLMSLLLLKVSGVALLEKDIAVRRPEYRDYVSRTNAFFPGPPRPGKP